MSNPNRRERIESENTVAAWVNDGMTIAVGEPFPMALVRALIRRKVKNLTVICSGIALDMLIASGCARKVIAYYAGGGIGVPVAPSFRRAAESGEIEVWECEEGILTSGLEAAGKNLPYLPWRGGVGTSIPELNTDLKLIEDPINGEALIAVPAIKPDVAFLHAAQADAFGNVQHHGGPGWIDLFLHRAADKTVVQVEKIISNEQIRASAWHTTIDNADAVVRAPYGAHPFYSRGHYVQDTAFVQSYLAAAQKASNDNDHTDLDKFFNGFIEKPHSHAEYLEKVGIKRLLELYEY